MPPSVQLSNLSEVSTVLVAISLATERLVVVVKTVFPKLATAPTLPPGADENVHDRGRRLMVIGVAYLCALVTSWFVAGGWFIQYADHSRQLSVFAVALLASGGSAFWTQVVGFASAAKDARQVEAKQLHQDADLSKETDLPVPLITPSGLGTPSQVPKLPVLPQ